MTATTMGGGNPTGSSDKQRGMESISFPLATWADIDGRKVTRYDLFVRTIRGTEPFLDSIRELKVILVGHGDDVNYIAFSIA